MATSCDRSQVKEVVGVVPLVVGDGKSSCSRDRRVKLESGGGGELFSEFLVFKKEPKTQDSQPDPFFKLEQTHRRRL